MLNKITEFIFIIVFALVLLVAVMGANAYACNQRAYDTIYKRITQEALKQSLRAITEEEQQLVIQERLEAIAGLRVLCENQLSSYEVSK